MNNQTFAKAVRKTTVWIYARESVMKLFATSHPIVRAVLEQSV